ncbi:hypothetical protein Lal_00039698 [Lupinus albus]|uniref:Uncharacterized protein n=1 Tax=Lupinus albus TaxID=3870 RepID=A0A6A4QGQ9_LUPAL|nr:hypothetical protein Lalb_Chr06g0172931 [Lupinus albus]KAF1879754.1 hypothetical protein Lal_00039698 [Lupinus albus]
MATVVNVQYTSQTCRFSALWKSCRLRCINYLRPNIKRGPFTTIFQLHDTLDNRNYWSMSPPKEQRYLIMLALSIGDVALTKDTNGLHVVEHFLKHFSSEDNKEV